MQKLNKVLSVSVLAIFGLAFFIGTAKAQLISEIGIPKAEPVAPPSAPTETLPGTVNCFDYYRFGSVQVDVESEVASTVAGVPMIFRGTIKNDNNYPVVDGQVYVKVFRKQADSNKAHANGSFLVDQFFAAENVNLGAKENKMITFDWKIPNYALPGDYQIATFFTSAKKFNLLGLSFTDDVVGNTFSFAVKGENKSGVEFNKNAVKINDKDYQFAAFPPRFSKDEDIVVKTDLVNSTKQAQSIPVTWTLYSWDGLQSEKVLDAKQETVALKAGETKNLAYTIQNKDYPVYFLVVQAQFKDTKSILDIRTVRQDVNRTRINFPAVTSYPLKQGEKNTLFVCAHNSGAADFVDNNKLVVTLLDEDQKEIHKYTYDGKISGAMMGLKEDFTPQGNYESFYIKSELFTDGKLVDTATMKYDCQQLTLGKCKGKGLPALTASNKQNEKSWLTLSMLIGIVFLLIGILAIVVYKKKHNSRIGMFLLVFMLGAIMFVSSGKLVAAKSVPWSSGAIATKLYGTGYTYNPSRDGCTTNGFCLPGGKNGGCAGCPNFNYSWWAGTSNFNVNIIYNAQVTNQDTGAIISDGDSVLVGSKLKFEKIESSLSWNGMGYSLDTPYGYWMNNADAIPACSMGNIISSAGRFDYFTGLSVNPPNVVFDHSGSSAGLSCDGSGANCIVTSAGNIKTDMTYASTFGKFYYSFKATSDINNGNTAYYNYNLDSVTSGTCKSSNAPMRECVTVKYSDGAGIDNWADLCSYPSANDYILTVPAQTITYNLTAVAAGNPPAPPIVTGSTTGVTDTAYSFSATSTDPDAGDTVRYGFDWNKDGVVDQWAPSASTAPVYVASGTSQSASYTWTTTGAKTFQVLAQDQTDNSSAWTPFTITLSAPANCPADCTSWSGWGGCSATCGGGTQQQTCTSAICNGSIAQQACNTQACPTNNFWKEVTP